MPRSSLLREMWPVLSMMRLLGWLPAHRRHDSDTLHVRPANLVYCGVVLTVQLVPAMYIVVKGFMLTSQMDQQILLISYLQLVLGVLVPQMMPLLAAWQAPQHVEFCNEMSAFQVSVERLSVTGRPLVFGLRGLSQAVRVMYLVPGLGILVLRPLVLWERPTWTLDLFFSLSLGNLSLLLGWWIIVMTAIRKASQRLADEFQLLREYNKAGRQLDQLAMSTRPLWLQLCRLVRGSGDALAFAQSFLLFDCFTVFLYFSYNLMNRQTAGTTIFFIIAVFLSGSIVYILCITAQSAKEKVHRDINSAMSVINNLNISLQIREELLRCLVHLNKRSPEVSFRGYLRVGRGLISTLVAALVSNLVVLYQLKITERRLNFNDFFTFGDQNAL